MKKRSVVLFAGLLLLLCGIVTQLYRLSDGDLRPAAERQATTTVTVATARGTIYDRKLRPLVNTGEELRLCVAPYPTAIARLSELLGGERFDQLSGRLQEGHPVVAVVDKWLSPLEGMVQLRVPVRYGGSLPAPHLLGYLDSTGHGVTGMEAVLDELLVDHSGEVTVTYGIDGAGQLLSGVSPTVADTLANAAGGAALTIDRDIQRIVERSAEKYLTNGAVVMMDPADGNILAMASFPSFQPETVASLLNNEDGALRNRVLGSYNCGSVFKIVSAAAALEAGVPVSRCYTCIGSVTVDGVTFHCHNRLGHGELDMTAAFAASCNCYFIQLMQEVGGDALYELAVTLGFDRSLILAEGYRTARAVLPAKEELTFAPALANLSFGQGALMATPMHIAQLVTTVVNNGELLRPNVLLGTVDANGVLTREPQTPTQHAFSDATAATLRSMMVAATAERATGASAAPQNGGAGGKTGTAETGWVTENGAVVQSWFAGFYPAKSPRYVIVVLAEDSETTGGRSAPVFRRICEELYALGL